MIRFSDNRHKFYCGSIFEAAGQCSRLMHTAVYSGSRDTGEQLAKKHGKHGVYRFDRIGRGGRNRCSPYSKPGIFCIVNRRCLC